MHHIVDFVGIVLSFDGAVYFWGDCLAEFVIPLHNIVLKQVNFFIGFVDIACEEATHSLYALRREHSRRLELNMVYIVEVMRLVVIVVL